MTSNPTNTQRDNGMDGDENVCGRNLRREKVEAKNQAAMGQAFFLTSGSQIENGRTVGRIGLSPASQGPQRRA